MALGMPFLLGARANAAITAKIGTDRVFALRSAHQVLSIAQSRSEARCCRLRGEYGPEVYLTVTLTNFRLPT